MTADHTPERLSAEFRQLWQAYCDEKEARADVEARLAAVEALADALNVEGQEAEAGYDELTMTTPGKRKERAYLRTVSLERKRAALRVRAALHPDPSEPGT